jgi:ATP phosphoribosyltransferase regulatory subunit HisZ
MFRMYKADMKQTLVAALLGIVASLAAASPTSPPVRAEIEALLARLESSGCQFDRNGSWHSPSEARSHLLRKLDYIEGKGVVQSTEQFIELAAAKSSWSGKPYRVKCGAEAAVDSQQWLNRQLTGLRSSGAKPKP